VLWFQWRVPWTRPSLCMNSLSFQKAAMVAGSHLQKSLSVIGQPVEIRMITLQLSMLAAAWILRLPRCVQMCTQPHSGTADFSLIQTLSGLPIDDDQMGCFLMNVGRHTWTRSIWELEHCAFCLAMYSINNKLWRETLYTLQGVEG
jgi:hypothetical protein